MMSPLILVAGNMFPPPPARWRRPLGAGFCKCTRLCATGAPCAERPVSVCLCVCMSVCRCRYGRGPARPSASLAAVSRHPLSRALVTAAEQRFGAVEATAAAVETPGYGIRADGTRLGSAHWCEVADDGYEMPSVWLTRQGQTPTAFRFAIEAHGSIV